MANVHYRLVVFPLDQGLRGIHAGWGDSQTRHVQIRGRKADLAA